MHRIAIHLSLLTGFSVANAPVLGQSCNPWVPRHPAPDRDYAMAYDAVRAVMVVHGPITGDTDDGGETWEWDGAA